MALLSIQNLVKNYATQRAVDDISFDIQQGSIFGLLGPNGAGKSTLLRMITGIFYPDAGSILFDGKEFKPEQHQDMIGYMPEERGLYKKMKIGEQVLYLAQLRGLDIQTATRNAKYWFEKLGMESWWDKKTEDLSKGMGQKLQFVSTVLHDPKLLILDEPFSGLDPVNADVIKNEIFELSKKGTTIIFSTHRMEQVEEICDQIALIHFGKKILDGKVSKLKQQFKENIFEIQTNENIHPDAQLMTVLDTNQNLVKFSPKDGYGSNDILKYYIAQNAHIESFREILPSLHEIFIRLVKESPTARAFVNEK